MHTGRAVARPGWVLAARLHVDLLRVSTALCPAPAPAV
ncbi:putative leader peptide [Kitasatospora sp. NPDC059795]